MLDKNKLAALISADDEKIQRSTRSENYSLEFKWYPTIEKSAIDKQFKHNLSKYHVMNILPHLTQSAFTLRANPLPIVSFERSRACNHGELGHQLKLQNNMFLGLISEAGTQLDKMSKTKTLRDRPQHPR